MPHSICNLKCNQCRHWTWRDTMQAVTILQAKCMFKIHSMANNNNNNHFVITWLARKRLCIASSTFARVLTQGRWTMAAIKFTLHFTSKIAPDKCTATNDGCDGEDSIRKLNVLRKAQKHLVVCKWEDIVNRISYRFRKSDEITNVFSFLLAHASAGCLFLDTPECYSGEHKCRTQPNILVVHLQLFRKHHHLSGIDLECHSGNYAIPYTERRIEWINSSTLDSSSVYMLLHRVCYRLLFHSFHKVQASFFPQLHSNTNGFVLYVKHRFGTEKIVLRLTQPYPQRKKNTRAKISDERTTEHNDNNK